MKKAGLWFWMQALCLRPPTLQIPDQGKVLRRERALEVVKEREDPAKHVGDSRLAKGPICPRPRAKL